MIVLDTNVVSELMRAEPNSAVLNWLDGQHTSEVVLTAVTAAELRAGVALLPTERRRRKIAEQVEALIDESFSGAVLPFDVDSSAQYADIVGPRTRTGNPISISDAQIAAICRQHDATLATRNTRDFIDTDIALTNPWQPVVS